MRLIQLSLKDKAQNETALTLPSRRQSATEFSIPLPELAASEYTVNWMVMGEDTTETGVILGARVWF
ncbi:copper resistance protein CopC [Aliidiomarina taiwanensis]|uniref:copper resistance protein CopC n=1 Tax=Aliidiomarina taiwanensis TaxID=946228 RepID=UPI001F544434|nr:copper resistance protein CopC [Aliidiomarina taiwanensis]